MKLPTDHISASQLALWTSDMGEYYKRYFRGEQAPETPSTLLGSRVAKALEHIHDSGEFPDDATETEMEVYQRLDFLGVPECKLVQDLAPGITAIGYIDTIREDWERLVDYKTGHRPWDLDRVKNSVQLKFYALLVRELVGTIPEVGINWIETAQVPGTSLIEFTGRLEKIYHRFTSSELDEFRAWVIETTHDIARHYAAYLGALPGFVPDVLAQYERSRKALEEAKRREAQDREIYVKHLQDFGIRRAETKGGTFYAYQRTAYDYPDYVNRIADHLKKAQTEAIENGEAEARETTVWMFRAKKQGS